MLKILPCLDSPQMALDRQRELQIPRHEAQALGASAVVSAREGRYFDANSHPIDWESAVQNAVASKISIPPDQALPERMDRHFEQTLVQISNETTLGASRRLSIPGTRPLALNFANGVEPGGGFLFGALAQEETLCRSSALFLTLDGDPMYEAHRQRPLPDSTDWSIYSPDVPVFRNDEGIALNKPWLLSFITCAAPIATHIGKALSEDLLRLRINRVLAIACAYDYSSLVLGAWGCGAFGNDPLKTAEDFRYALEERFSGKFERVDFAITDWSPDRKFLGPFRDVFS